MIRNVRICIHHCSRCICNKQKKAREVLELNGNLRRRPSLRTERLALIVQMFFYYRIYLAFVLALSWFEKRKVCTLIFSGLALWLRIQLARSKHSKSMVQRN